MVFITKTESVYCAVRTGSYVSDRFNLSLLGLGFNPRPVLVGFVLDKVAPVQFFSPSALVFPVTITPRMLHTQLYVAFARTNGRRLVGPFKKQCSYRSRRTLDR